MELKQISENEFQVSISAEDLHEFQNQLRDNPNNDIYFLGCKVECNWLIYFIDTLISLLMFYGAIYIFTIRTIEYETIDPKGASGYKTNALVLHPSIFKSSIIKNQKYPILAYHHGTQLMRKYAPSNFKDNILFKDISVSIGILDQIIFAFIAGLKGYIVVMPDYQGMNSDESLVQPYIVSKCLGRCGADAIAHLISIKYFKEKWNGQLFVTGYSEGGYAAMAVSKELQQNYSQFKVTASAPAAGPYSLSDSMRLLMLRDELYEDGYYLPMILRAYNQVYGDIFSKEKVLNEEYQRLYELVDGTHSPEEVNEAMKNNEGILIPKNVMSQELIKELSNTNSKVCEYLNDNDLISWKPEMPMRLYHNLRDDRVPYSNAEIAAKAFQGEGSNVAVIEGCSMPFSKCEHVNGFIPYLLNSIAWFDSYQYDSKINMVKSGGFLLTGCSIKSTNKKFELRYQFDGDLVIYHLKTGEKKWNWNTRCESPYLCLLKDDGNFLAYDTNYNEIKSTNKTSKKGECRLIMEDNGKAIIYDKDNGIVCTLNE